MGGVSLSIIVDALGVAERLKRSEAENLRKKFSSSLKCFTVHQIRKANDNDIP